MAVNRFLGPYHASQLVNYATNCGYAFRLQNIENVAEAHRHGKALLGDVVHFLLEGFHTGQFPGPGLSEDDDRDTWAYWSDLLEATWKELCDSGNPRYPERNGLPLYFGRIKDGYGSRQLERHEFEAMWMPKATQWLVEYTSRPYNWEWVKQEGHDHKGPQSLLLEVGYQLFVGDYEILGRFDQIRRHYSLETVPASLFDQERIRPGAREELVARLKKKGHLTELSDWKSTKDKPIFRSQNDPYVVFNKTYQPRIYALGLAEGTLGEIERAVIRPGLAEEKFVPSKPFGEMPDFYTWHWLPGYERRTRGDRNPQHKGKRFKAGTEPADLYVDGRAPGDPVEADPRFSVLIRPFDLEATKKDIRRVIAAIRLGQFYRAPGQFTCTSCRFTRECEQDLEQPILDKKFFDAFSEEDYFEEERPPIDAEDK